MRPLHLDEFVGQTHLLGTERPLRRLAEAGSVHSMILWGPPGVGKTTLARLLAEAAGARFESLSAVLSGLKDVRAARRSVGGGLRVAPEPEAVRAALRERVA